MISSSHGLCGYSQIRCPRAGCSGTQETEAGGSEVEGYSVIHEGPLDSTRSTPDAMSWGLDSDYPEYSNCKSEQTLNKECYNPDGYWKSVSVKAKTDRH